MSLVHSEIGGLLVATEASDEKSVRAQLKQIDSRYMLDCVRVENQLVWVVLCRIGSDTPPMVVTNWLGEAGQALPLSSGLVEKVKRLRLDGRGPVVDVMAENDKLREKNRAEFAEQADDAARHQMKHKGQWRYFFGDSQLDPLKIRAARMKAERADG